MIIADTDVLIDYLAGKGETDSVERLLRQGALRTTVITRFELLSGAKNAKQLARCNYSTRCRRSGWTTRLPTLRARFADPWNDQEIRSGWRTV
jgi:predicted nucleic acid-binding protein